MLKKHKELFVIILIAAAVLYFNPGQVSTPVEKSDILSGISVDYVKDDKGQTENMLSMSTYTFNEENKISSMIVSGTGMTIPETRCSRQLQANHKLMFALQKVIILSEDVCKSGIEDSLDILFSNELMNDMGWAIVCKGKALEILKQKVDEYPSSSDYIAGMIENLKDYNFFSDNYKIMDIYVRVDAEGRSLVLPYIEIVDDKLKITGMALFDNDTMVQKIDIDDARLMNMLRADKLTGTLELEESLKKYTSTYGVTKRKVSCEKKGTKYSFVIDLSFKGDIVNNTLIEDLAKDPEVISEFEREIGKQTQKQCEEFIDRMQNDYKVDCLELGRVACAKYGRNTGVDWNEVISDSDITVNVKVQIEGAGRGNYTTSSDN